MKMIKLLEKDLRTYRKDTFITSFFATITILLIVLIICSIPSHAQEISGTNTKGDTFSYDDDTSNMTNLTNNYNIDTTLTTPQGLLNKEDSNVKTLIPDRTNIDNAPDVYFLASKNSSNHADGWLDRSIPKTWTYNGTTYNLSDFSNFALLSSSLNPAGGGFYELCLSDSSFGYYYTGRYLNEYDITSDGTCFMFIGNNNNNSFVIKSGISTTYDYSGMNVNFQKTTNSLHNSYDMLVYANCSVTGLSYVLNEQGNARVPSSPDGMEYNYLNGQAGNGGTGDDGGETPENNMYLKSADFKFNIHKYGDIDNNDSTADNVDFARSNMVYKNYWGNKSGLIDFECVPTDYQIEHAEEFYLYFQFNLIQRFDALSPAFNSEPNLILYPFKSHSINTTTTTSFYNKIYFDDLIEDSNRVTWRIDDLFDDLTITACNVPYLTGVTNNDSFTSAVAQERELGGVIWKNDNNLGYIIQCYAFLGCDTDTLTDAGSYSETYGFCSQVSKNTDDSITTNPNPYVPSDDTNSDGKPDSTQTVVNDGNVSLINNNYDNDNNNQTVNITSDDAELVDTLTDKFIPSNMDNTGGLTTQFTELANTNGYINFFKNTFSFVPVAVWNTLLVLLGTTCSIIAVAFVIKVLRGM